MKITQLFLQLRKKILHKLNQAVAFENYLQYEIVGQNVSLEGGESLIPAPDQLISRSSFME